MKIRKSVYSGEQNNRPLEKILANFAISFCQPLAFLCTNAFFTSKFNIEMSKCELFKRSRPLPQRLPASEGHDKFAFLEDSIRCAHGLQISLKFGQCFHSKDFFYILRKSDFSLWFQSILRNNPEISSFKNLHASEIPDIYRIKFSVPILQNQKLSSYISDKFRRDPIYTSSTALRLQRSEEIPDI